MPRLMSFAKTVEPFRDGTKLETRRDGWQFLEPGDLIEGVDRSPRSGQGYERLGLAIVETVRRELLTRITEDGVTREGFPGKSWEWFVRMFCGGEIDFEREVTVITFAECGDCERRAAWRCEKCGLCLCAEHAPAASTCRSCEGWEFAAIQEGEADD